MSTLASAVACGDQYEVDALAFNFAARYGSFSLHFSAAANYASPDYAPWTLELDNDSTRSWGGFTAEETVKFADSELSE